MTLVPDLIGKALSNKVAEKAYDDLLSVPLKEVSKLAAYFIRAVQLCCFPFQFAAACQERLEKRLRIAIEQAPEENRIEPPMSILVPVVNHLNYVEDGNLLTELYQNLLARAMDKTRNSEAHPGFIVTISQLSPDEALLLYELKFKQLSFTKEQDYRQQSGKFFNRRMINNEFPTKKLIFSGNFDMYIDHLKKLGLICIIDKQKHQIWKDGSNNQELIGIRETYTMGFTQFGALFVKACLPDKEQML